MSLKDKTRTVAEAMSNVFELPYPSLGLDLDGTIDEAPIFFQVLSQRWPGKVFIITYRKDRAKAEADVQKYNVRYDELILVDSFANKAKILVERGISYYFDDQDEMTSGIPETVKVFKIRNGGNFDFDEKKWLYSNQTGMEI
jgi:glutaredoxin-related protein